MALCQTLSRPGGRCQCDAYRAPQIIHARERSCAVRRFRRRPFLRETKQNFADIVNLRKYLLAQGPGGKYNQARAPSNLRSVYGMAGFAIMDQIEVNAVARFTVPIFPF